MIALLYNSIVNYIRPGVLYKLKHSKRFTTKTCIKSAPYLYQRSAKLALNLKLY